MDSFDEELNLLGTTFAAEEQDEFGSLVFRGKRRRLQDEEGG